MSDSRTIIIFGAGPGIGNHIAASFLSHGFTHAILLSRNQTRLQEDAAFISSKSGIPTTNISTIPLDLSDLASIPAALSAIEKAVPKSSLEAIIFNAARIRASPVLSTPVDEIETDFRVTNLALYIVAQWGIPLLQARAKEVGGKPALLVTNSHLPWAPIPDLLSLSLVKASQRNMVQSFAQAFADSGVHVGLISVEGSVAPEFPNLNPGNIAEKTWGFYEEGKGLDVKIVE